MKLFLKIFILLVSITVFAQTNSYSISFENAVHHEAKITVSFPQVGTDTLEVRMSRTSPGRYALHEFAKNVYDFKAKDAKGNMLKVVRPDPYSWQIIGQYSDVSISYTLFANRGDGTYSQIDETHAHLNIPATFMYAPKYTSRTIEIDFKTREDLNWKIATQLPLVSGTRHSAPNMYYFMDSPTELSNHDLRAFEVESNGVKQNIQLALHHNGSQEETDQYFEKVKKVVLAEQEVYGELPAFDYGRYTFLACYIPNASGDGMEHRNSTILTSTRSLADGGMERNIGTVSHEFFHAWNVERIRPKTLEPFDFEEANMSGALWFAEGFTSYYTNLILCRAGLITAENYVEGLTGTFNYVWNSPARSFFNPIEMSYQAPFVDASTSVDPVNRENTFISYYSYGSMLGLALDLSLRENGLNLDDYMKLVWRRYGKNEISYTIENLKDTLKSYAGNSFGNDFFNTYIHKSEMPNYEKLLSSVGVVLKQNSDSPDLGFALKSGENTVLKSNIKIGSPAYEAGLAKGDEIIAINDTSFPNEISFKDFINQFKIGDKVSVQYKRFGEERLTDLIVGDDLTYSISLAEKEGIEPSAQAISKRKEWLKVK